MPRRPVIAAVLTAVALAAALPAPASAELDLGTGDVLAPVVDATGQLIGTVDQTTGQVVDETGTVIGTVDQTTGQVVDEAGNVIGTVAPAQTGGAGGTGQAPGGATGTGGSGSANQLAPLSFGFSARRVQRSRIAGRRGIVARGRCSRACAVFAQLTVTPTVARRLRLGRRTAVIGFATATRSGAFRVRLTPRARRAIDRWLSPRANRRRGVRVTLSAVAFDVTGSPSRIRTRRVTLMR